MGHVAAEFLTQRRRVVREYLPTVRTSRDGNVGHAAVKQVFRAEFGVHMDQRSAVCGLPFGLGSNGW